MVFSLILLLIWVGERWYLNSLVQKRSETKPFGDDEKLRRINSRAINAKKDQFRRGTRTRVIYHESVKSGANHIDHSYLLDVGEKIAIQQVSENKLKVTDSFIVEPPYPETQYFELIIREFSEDGLSQVDDLQIYPVFVTQKPDKRVPANALHQDTFEILERIYAAFLPTQMVA